VKGTNTKVAEIVLDNRAWGWSAEKIHEEHPHLSMAQVHAALLYYYEHKEEIDGQIEAADREVEQLRAAQENSDFVKKLRAFKNAR